MGHSEAQVNGSRGHRTASVRHTLENRPVWWGGMLVSLVLHALVFLLWVTEVPFGDGGAPGRRTPTVTAGGGGVRAIRVAIPDVRQIPPPPRPMLSVEVPEVEVREVEVAALSGDLLPVGSPAPLPGIGGGSGRGDGGEGGAGDGYSSPVPRSVVPHWDPPGSVRGLEVTVRVFVDATGRPSLVELDPPTPDDTFNREIMREVRAWEYRPARRRGVPVEGWAEITFIF